MACIYSNSDENVSDSDLEWGLPSSDESDDEQIKTSTDIGVTVPNFCNKLREQTRPLLVLHHGVPSPSKQLRENVPDRSKESKAKKRLFKGPSQISKTHSIQRRIGFPTRKQQPSTGVIERRYGYIPNPRWPKSFSYARPYEPVGVGDKDRDGIPGVVFRERLKSESEGCERSTCEHSYLESDFPVLNISTSDRSQKYDTPVLHSSHLEGTSNASAHICQNEPQLIDTSLPLSNLKLVSTSVNSHESPSTSTPIKQESICQLTPSPVVDSGESSVFTSDSADSTHSSQKSYVVSSIRHNVARKRCKKLCPVPPADRSSSVSFQAVDSDDSPNLCNSKQDELLLSGMLNRNSTWSDMMKLESGINHNEKNGFPPLQKLSDMNHNCSIGADITFMRQLSPASPVVSSESEKSFLSKHSLTCTVPVSLSSAWSNIARGSSGQKDKMVSPGSLSPGQLNSHTEKSTPPSGNLSKPAEPLNFSTEQSDECELMKSQRDKGARSKNRKFKTSDNSNNEGASKNHPASNFGSRGSQNRVQNYSRGNNRNSSSVSRTLTLESFMTPQKNTRKKNGAPSSRKDFDMFQSRFVEKLSANPVSPPKKVRPSPIKKLSFSKHEEALMVGQEHGESDSGSSKTLDMLHGDYKDLLPPKQVIEMKLDERGDNTNTGQVGMKGRQKAKILLDGTGIVSTKKQSEPIFSLERSLRKKDVQNKKDVFEVEDENDDEYSENDNNKEAEIFWTLKSVNRRKCLQVSDCNKSVPRESSEEDDDENGVAIAAAHSSANKQQMFNPGNADTVDGAKQDCLSKVSYKSVLRKYARRYCHYVEEHQVPNIAIELYFIIQLLTCTDVDTNMLNFIEKSGQKTYFQSVHNGVYFAVIVIKRLRRLFLALDRTYLELLAACPHILAFSPKLHRFFVQAVKDRLEDPIVPTPVEHATFNPQENGTLSFSDTNNAHVFKCQRDNFYAFYRHYHDTSSIYEFRIENQIQYVFDGCTPEQNSVVNLMHLAKLYLEHMILCCVKQTEERVDVLKMIQAKGQKEDLFASLYEVFCETTSTSSASPLPGFSDRQMFFKDFIGTLSCPAFNEHLKNLVVCRILELNATNFSSVMDLHSAATVAEDKTPLRAGKFTETVKTLCVLGKLLGYLTFAPYTSGPHNIPNDQAAELLTMREMNPIPLPLPLLLKQAFDCGHLCLTVPWVVEYLAMMDQMASQLSVYGSLLRKLHFIQRYAWTALYKEGHLYSGLLIVSCISWLFETPAVPEGFFFLHDVNEEISALTSSSHSFQIDRQKLVCQHLLSWCCPYLEQGQVLLTLFLLKQPSVTTERSVLPVSHPERSKNGTTATELMKEVAEIEKWLGTAFQQETKHFENKRHTRIIDDEVVPAYVLTRLLTKRDTDELEDLEVHLIQNSPYLKASIDTTVDLLCAKLTHYTHKMILKLLVFEAKADVRMLFQGVSGGIESEAVKDKILAEANLRANKYSEKAKESFCALCERSFGKELLDLLLFLTSNTEEDVRQSAVHIARKLVIRRLQEWADVQLGPALFRRILVREAEKCAKTTPKCVPLYPNDYSKKFEELSCPNLNPGFTEHEQLSELIDKALSYGVWYINALSPGVRPDDLHMVQLIEDFTNCVEKKMITMDFAFSVMANFLMHLIIQYIVDAPQNWTQQAEDAFIRLCILCKERKLENGKISNNKSDLIKKKKMLKVKVHNFLSVYSVQWLTKSESQLETLMAYCKLVCRLVTAELLYVDTVYKKLVHSRENGNLHAQAKMVVNKALVKVLEMLFENDTADIKSYSPDRILTLVEDLAKPLGTIPEEEWDDVLSALAVRVKSTFASVLDFSFQCEQH